MFFDLLLRECCNPQIPNIPNIQRKRVDKMCVPNAETIATFLGTPKANAMPVQVISRNPTKFKDGTGSTERIIRVEAQTISVYER